MLNCSALDVDLNNDNDFADAGEAGHTSGTLTDDVALLTLSSALSVGTVRNYLTTVVTKLNARNRVDAIRVARESGWL